MVNVIPPDHVDEVPVVEPNQHDDVLIVLEPVLVDEDIDPEEGEFKEEEDPQEEENDMEPDIKEDKNEPELTYPYEDVDPLNPPPLASESEPDDEIEVKNPIEHEDETVLASVHETSHELVEKKGKAKDKFYGKLILELGNEVRSSVEQGTAAMEKLVENLGNTEDKVECKKLKKELEEARIMPPKSAPMTQAAIRRMIKDSVYTAIAAERERQANVRNDASRSGPVRGQDATPVVHEYTFAGFMKCNSAVFCGVERVIKLQRWFEKTKSVFEISECAEGKNVKFTAVILEGPSLTWWKTKVATMGLETADAYIRGLTDNIKGEVTSSKPPDLNEALRMAHKFMDQKSQARDARILEGKKRKWESLQGGKSSGKGKQRDNSRHTLQNSQKQGNAVRSSVTSMERLGIRQGPNVVTGTFLLNNRYAFVLFDSCSDRSFVDTRFSAMLDIDPIKIGASYEVELADERAYWDGPIRRIEFVSASVVEIDLTRSLRLASVKLESWSCCSISPSLERSTKLSVQGKVKLLGSFSIWGMELSICKASYSLLFCGVDKAYWDGPIRRIEFVSASVVEIDLTRSLRLASVKLVDKAYWDGPIRRIEFVSASVVKIDLTRSLRQHGQMILESVENGPLICPTIEENGVTRPKKYYELSTTKAIQANCDVKETNIILQRLPPELLELMLLKRSKENTKCVSAANEELTAA
nr:putative zinc finger, CCHC-type, retrotransposon Gag domain protein [Tanacetum cinerariifolium]